MDRISPGKRGDERTNTSVRRTTTGFGEIVMVEYKGGITHGQREFGRIEGKTSTHFLSKSLPLAASLTSLEKRVKAFALNGERTQHA